MTSELADNERATDASAGAKSSSVRGLIERHAHLLPSQGPISVFVHHNTLHAFEELPFHEAVAAAGDLYDCHPYLPEEEYRRAVASGRITKADLAEELFCVLGDEGDRLIGHLGARHDLRMSMLALPLHEGDAHEVRWYIEETEALFRFRGDVEADAVQRAVNASKRWLVRDYFNGTQSSCPIRDAVDGFTCLRGGSAGASSWDQPTDEAFSLHLLWAACQHGSRLRGPLAASDGSLPQDNSRVDELLVRFCAAFLDQGQANKILPGRKLGFFRSFVLLHRDGWLADHRLDGLQGRLDEIERELLGPEDVIEQSLNGLGVTDQERSDFLLQELLQLRGWAGLLWQMETNAEWTAWPAPRGTLVEYMAVRLLLQRVVAENQKADSGGVDQPATTEPDDDEAGSLRRAFVLFQIAQARGWSGVDLLNLSDDAWSLLLTELDDFNSRQRRRVFHQAYERNYRDRTLAAVNQACQRPASSDKLPDYQVVCCIDDREESFRRHLEEVDPDCETFGVAGFFGVAMYYRGLGEAHFRPLCPVNVKPAHYIVEQPTFSEEEASRRREAARRAIGKAAHGVTKGSRSVAGGLVAGVLGTLAAFPLVLRVIFPRLAQRLTQTANRFVGDAHTRLEIEASQEGHEREPTEQRYTVDEMGAIVAGVLRMTGLSSHLSPLVVICGHGSSSLNNPHAAAYDCGACGGGRGGPNARAFALMANDPRVREAVQKHGIEIPEETLFVGAYHNTCDDSVVYYDLDSLPPRCSDLLHRVQQSLEAARRRDAQERSRRFESADLTANPEQALRHVEGRAADLSQVRSECGHATNAICLVGHREWSRGLFLDRRAFLTSYDPAVDDEEHSVLAGLLSAVIPVCAGINLEYYFSRVDNPGYGCGTKLPHNVAGLLGVMDGAGSDLRTGLPWQMVEIHEPMRILFIVETTPDVMQRIMTANPAIDRLVRGGWVQLATLDPERGEQHLFEAGEFRKWAGSSEPLPAAGSSAFWFRGQRDHLDFALIGESSHPALAVGGGL